MSRLSTAGSVAGHVVRAVVCAGLLGGVSGCGYRRAENVLDRVLGKKDDPQNPCKEARSAWNNNVGSLREDGGPFPHMGSGFTEGLAFHEKKVLFESTGPAGEGGLRRMPRPGDVPSAQAKENVAFLRKLVPNLLPVFPEGVASSGKEIFQLTLNHGFARVWDPETMVEKRRVHFKGKGWGLCYDGTQFIRSDGTDTLYFHAADTFKEDKGKRVRVKLGGRPLLELNELECNSRSIYANVWFTNQIVRIDPGTGDVTHVFDAESLAKHHSIHGRDEQDNVLNGIAYDGTHFFLTGKRWDKIYKVRLEPNPEKEPLTPPYLPTCLNPAPPPKPPVAASAKPPVAAPPATSAPPAPTRPPPAGPVTPGSP